MRLLAAVLLILTAPIPVPDCRVIHGQKVCRFDPAQQCLNPVLSDGSYSKCVKEVAA
jgi:hypothetical protein